MATFDICMCHSLNKHPTGQPIQLINRSWINKERCEPQHHRPRERAYRAGHRPERADEPMQAQESYALNSMRGTPPKHDVPLTTQEEANKEKAGSSDPAYWWAILGSNQ
ncbi:hypothetical protein [Schaalia odontolytica]